MKQKRHIILIFLLISLLTLQTFAEEKIYKATRAEDSKSAFVGGSACCNCLCDTEGKLPADFPPTNVHSVTFYLLGSRSSSVFDKIKVGPTKLRLILGNSQSVALTAAWPSEVIDPVKHKWYVTFIFDPPVQVGPETEWKLLDGDGTWKSAAIAHTSDKPSGGLPGKFITKNCQYARTENHWYSVKFDFAAAEPVPSKGLNIVKKGPLEFLILLNGKEIYSAPMFDVSIIKSFKAIDGFNVDVLVENAGGNICQTYSCRIISWRPDGKYKVSDKFGNCQGPKISQEGNKIYLAFESYTMRHSGITAPAETWVYENGILSQVALPGLYPRPVLQSPQKNAVLPQGNNSECPRGYIWNFSWTIPNPQNVKLYQIRITRPWLKDPVLEDTVKDSKYVWDSCNPIDDEDLERWRWQVRAFYNDGKWSEWSDSNDFNVALLDISVPLDFSFVTSKKCMMCHKGAKKGEVFEKWEKGPHAKAFENLIAKGEDKNPICLACHTTGYDGSVFKEEGVGCEACHGPGSDYKKMSVMKNKEEAIELGLIVPSEAVCKKCHNEKSPAFKGFNFAEFFKKIDHTFRK